MNKNNDERQSFSYKYFVAYEIEGLTIPADKEPEIILDSNKDNCIASLFSDPKHFPADPLRSEAIRDVVLFGLTGKASELSREDQIEHHIKNKLPSHPDLRKCYLSFVFKGSIAIPRINQEAAYGNYDVAFINLPYTELDKRHKKVIDGIISAISITSENYQGHNRLYKSCVLYRNTRPLHALHFNITTKLLSITPLTDADFTTIKDRTRKLIQHQDLSLPSGLLSKSLDKDNDRLLSFIAAWNGLEIFIQKTYKKFEDRIYEEKIEGKSPASRDFIEQLRKISQNKLKLNDKFTIFAAMNDLPESDRTLFDEIKKIRDNLVHGKDIPVEYLPLEATSKLLQRILSLQL
ncbi:hypothetical protein [Pseudomonas oryzihabitans]|uniref:hypothetical protein n=1 Tax=Pseudomonas oryzihabitans TaxID=47885 RepID=UPI00241CEA06|nr:hypothetical protein [Pseudomonas oryzihabitans]